MGGLPGAATPGAQITAVEVTSHGTHYNTRLRLGAITDAANDYDIASSLV